MSANDRTGVGAGTGEWQTPPALFRRLNETFAFTYDAFASHGNHLRGLYSTAEGTWLSGFVVEGAVQIPPRKAGDGDGLTYPWEAQRVFMNPPYTRGFIERAMAKAAAERDSAALIVALIPAATDTRWFHESVLPFAWVEFLPKRVRFVNPETGEEGASPPGGHCIVVYRKTWL